MKICGYDWEEIQVMQQGEYLGRKVTKISISDYALNVANDIQRFKIPVYEETRKTLNIKLPDGYILDGDLWEWSEENER